MRPLWKKKEMGGEKVNVMKDNLGLRLQSWTTSRSWPWNDVISLLTLHLDAGGLRDFWMTNYTLEYEALLRYNGMTEGGVDRVPQVLQIGDITLPFIVPFVGLLASAGCLFSLVADPETYPTVNTFEDLEKQEIPIASYDDLSVQLLSVVKEKYVNIKEKNIEFDEISTVLRMRKPPVVPITKTRRLIWRKNEIGGQKGHVLKDNLGIHLQSWTTSRSWPWNDAISLMTLYLDAGGLRDFWMINYTLEYEALLRFNEMAEGGLHKGPEGLPLGDIASPFIVLLGGLLASAVVLVVEMRLGIEDDFYLQIIRLVHLFTICLFVPDFERCNLKKK
ncbi:Protein of unknown function, partial [Gryllus bimaculatus]